MNQIIAIRYIDAFYSKNKKLGGIKSITHYSVGGLISASKDFIVVSFVEKEGVPWKGLLLPYVALIFNKKSKISETTGVKNKIKKIKKNILVGVFWKDLVYFESGILPSSYSLMYTEGKIYSITAEAIIIKNPETIKIAPKKAVNHPKKKVNISFLIIPRGFITDIEIYDK